MCLKEFSFKESFCLMCLCSHLVLFNWGFGSLLMGAQMMCLVLLSVCQKHIEIKYVFRTCFLIGAKVTDF